MKVINPSIFLLFISLFMMTSCVHEPLVGPSEEDPNGQDTTSTIRPCDPDTIYFERDILPILRSNCAIDGCHNSASAQKNIILESYQTVMESKIVRPFRLGNSELYEVITDSDPDDRMPPPPRPRLAQEQIQLIAKWINQGAVNATCSESLPCNLQEVSYSRDIQPIFQQNCNGCHNVTSPSGGVILTTYDEVKKVALNNRLLGSIFWQTGFKPMPNGGPQLDSCRLNKIKKWVEEGSINN